MSDRYDYVGPEEIIESVDPDSPRQHVTGASSVLEWLKATGQDLDIEDRVVATFIIDTDGQLWIADRHSEHVACARKGQVLSAGEMTFEVDGSSVEVVRVSNQSTGYCPDASSWSHVEEALERAELPHPSCFTDVFVIRRCPKCLAVNIIKDESYVCIVCGKPLHQTQ